MKRKLIKHFCPENVFKVFFLSFDLVKLGSL